MKTELENDNNFSSNNGKSNEKSVTDNQLYNKKRPAHAFQKGNKLGKGRPEGSRNNVTLALEAIAESQAEEILKVIAQKALEGDMMAAKMIADRVYPPRKGSRIPMDLPVLKNLSDLDEARLEIMKMLSGGLISLEESSMALENLNSNKVMIVDNDLIPRINRLLEEEKSKGVK